MKRRFVELALIALAIGIAVVLYRGPGREIVRGHVGDVAATMLVYALTSCWLARAKIWMRGSLTMAIALAIEFGQTWWKIDSSTASFVLGATWDPWDVVAYAIGVAIAIAYDRLRVGARRARSRPRRGAVASRPVPASSGE